MSNKNGRIRNINVRYYQKSKNRGIQFITRTAVLLAIVLAVQALRLPTYFTGPVVNGILIITTIFSGVASGVIIGCITPLVALMTGIIPSAALPIVPVIVVSNITLVVFFYFLDKANRYLAWLGAALAKFAVFYIFLNYLLELLGLQLPPPLIIAFQLPQLYTALAGGFLAIIIARYLKNVVD